ncbi:hypothetical protein ACH4MW_30245 [Streptomyces luteogriseus]|uniref:hypothetical protein n=1 Tax=Streptomyces luteogriseus TaxID=68233 RepID=UPI00378868D1
MRNTPTRSRSSVSSGGRRLRQLPVDGVGADAKVFLGVDASGRLLGPEVTGAAGALPVEVRERVSTG